MQIIPSMHINSPRRSLQTRGRNRPARNALHPPRGARSAIACRALSGAPALSRSRQSGLPRGPRAGRGGSGTLPGWPEPVSGAAPSPRPPRRRPVGHHRRWRRHLTSETASPVVADVPAVAPWRIEGPVVLKLLRPRWSRPRRRPPLAPSGLRPPRPRRDRPRRPPLRGRRRRPSRRPRQDRPGAAQPSPSVRLCRRVCGSRMTRTARSCGSRPAQRAPPPRPAPGPSSRLAWRPRPARARLSPPARVPWSCRRSARRGWGSRPPRSRHARRRPPSERGSPR